MTNSEVSNKQDNNQSTFLMLNRIMMLTIKVNKANQYGFVLSIWIKLISNSLLCKQQWEMKKKGYI